MDEDRPRVSQLARADWTRMAEPQDDAYDTDMFVRMAAVRHPCREPSRRSVPAWKSRVWFDIAPIYAGRLDFERDFARYRVAPPTHPNLPLAAALVDSWPLGAAQARSLIRVLHPALDPTVDDDVGWHDISSSSHSYDEAFGSLWATVHSPVGLAEAIVHEMAHHKLRACGVGFSSADCLVANLDDERYPSPLLDGRARPMPAVLHAHYALLHMIALDLAILRSGIAVAFPLVRALLRRHLTMVGEGDITLRRGLVVDECGAMFMPALRRWQIRLVSEAEVQL